MDQGGACGGDCGGVDSLVTSAFWIDKHVSSVVPAQAGTHNTRHFGNHRMDSRLRGNDEASVLSRK